MLRAIIVDDEKASRDTLIGMLSRYCGNVEVIGQAEGYENGLEVIRSMKPDIVFLDIQMPDGSGFRLLEEIGDLKFEVIFCTAYDQYAIKAIKYSALDYLLKPVVPDDLVKAIEKAEQKKDTGQISLNIKALLENLSAQNEPRKIVLSTAEKMHIVDIDDIIRCESDDYYTRFFFKDGKKLLISKTLKEHEELLGDKQFIRPHKSHLVNIKYIKGFLKNDGGYILMSDGTQVPVSRRKKEYVINALNNL
jgi:two-component system LytT family response regulator